MNHFENMKTQEYPIDRISASMINSYLECPQLFYYQYIAKIQLPQKQQHLLFGSAIHKALEMMTKGDPNPVSWFDKTLDINKLGEDEKHLHPELVKLGYEMLQNYKDYYPKLNGLYRLEGGQAEKYFRRKLINPITGQESTLPFSGVLDHLTIEGRIIDYKTAASFWDPDSAASKVQTLLYNLWYYSEFNEVAEETLYFVLLKKYKQHKHDQVIQVVSTHVSLEDMAAAFDEVELIVEKIRQGIYDAPKSGIGFFAKQELARYEEALLLQGGEI